MRGPGLALLLAGALAACAGQAPRPRDPEVCLKIFDDYDAAQWLYPQQYQLDDWGLSILQPEVGRPVRLMRTNGCLTVPSDLDGLPELAQRLQPYRIENSGAATKPKAISVGIVTDWGDDSRAKQFFRSLGYRARSIGEPALGRRILIGPFVTQGAVDQALAVAREAGFIAPHVAKHTRF